MKKTHKLSVLMAVLLLALVLLAGCVDQRTQYEKNDESGYTVSVKFDANGGVFAANTSVIVDSYNLSQLQADGQGNVQIPLLAPDNEARKNDACKAVRNGYFLAGWYATRRSTAEGYVYADRWDFETSRLSVAADGSYSSSQPVLTLYAAWVPLFELQLVDRATDQVVGTVAFDPTSESSTFQLPTWNRESGDLEMYRLPAYEGHTYEAAYYDAAGTQPVSGEKLIHSGCVDEATGTGKDTVLRLYADFRKGEWFRIHTAAQLADKARLSGNYILCADLDFSEVIWPTSFMHGKFTGTIEGGGYTIRNVSVTQTNNSKDNTGLFGQLTEAACIRDLCFENVTLTIQAGARKPANFGLLAGIIADAAQISGLTVKDSSLQIDSDCYFAGTDYRIGLICGVGDPTVAGDYAVSCTVTGADPSRINLTVDGNTVLLEFT